MNDEVTILGLYTSGVDRAELDTHVEVWSLNDWYQFYPGLIPARVFNVHFAPHTHASRNRFTGDWKAEYQKVVDAGGRIMVSEMIQGVQTTGQEVIPILRMTLKGWLLMNMPCSISLMIQYAGFSGAKKIRLRGVRLSDGEYVHQLRGILRALKLCSERGVEIDNPYQMDWEERMKEFPEWAGGQPTTMGSAPHIQKAFELQAAQELADGV